MGKKAPSFQMYPSDLLGSAKVRLMSADAKAFYSLLLLNIWEYDTQFSIPDDPNLISKLLEITPARWLKLREEIVEKSGALKRNKIGRLWSPRLRTEKAKSDKFSESQRDRANRRWSRGNAAAQPGECSPTPTPTLKKKETPLNAPPDRGALDSLRPDFEIFWKAYPKRSGNKTLVFERYKVARKEGTAEELLRGAQNYAAECKADNEGRGRGAKFIKWPQGWLSEKRWLIHQELSEEAKDDEAVKRLLSDAGRT